MAAIVERKNRHCVIYSYKDGEGKSKQKWETFKTYEEAKKRKLEIEYRHEIGKLEVPPCRTLRELLNEYVKLYGKNTWSMSVYQSNTALIRNYIGPVLGEMKLNEITPRVLEKYYQQLLKTKAAPKCTDKKQVKKTTLVGGGTVKKIHSLLRSCFHQAMKWELMERNPAELATVPKNESVKREIWDADTLFHALDVCQDEELKLAINLAFSCSLRIGELLGLTWDCVDISQKSIEAGKAFIYVNKELQRVNREAMNALEKKDVLRVFPEQRETSTTVLVLKKPKTRTSTRKVFLPKTVAKMLIEAKKKQGDVKEALGLEYEDYDLVMAGPFGCPMEASRINGRFNNLIKENDLPKVVFHSLRHTSITYKLKLNGGDIKSVQGDSGHAQAKMVTDQYSHVLDEDRRYNAELFEEAFYGGKGVDTVSRRRKHADIEPKVSENDGLTAETLAKILENPEMVTLLKTLAKSLS